MIYTIIVSLILAFFVAPLFVCFQRTKEKAYQWWHVPFWSFLYVVVLYVLFHNADVASWPGFNRLYDDYMVEVCYTLLCTFIWMCFCPILRRENVHEKLIHLFRQVFATWGDDSDKMLPFPYFIDYQNVVRSRVGKLFYKRLLGGVIISVALIYALFFILVESFGIEFYLMSAFGLMGLLPLVEYYHYLKAEVPEEEDMDLPAEEIKVTPSDLEKLWEQYTQIFPDYAIAWKRKFHQDVESEKNNQDKIDDLMVRFTGTESAKGIDGFLENYNLVDAFTKMEPLFNWEEENGRLILIVMDIPNHFSQSAGFSFLQETANALKDILEKKDALKVYDEYSPETDLNTSIVVASMSVLSSRNMDKSWMKRIGLVTVVNLFDKSVSNLYECRKFSYLLHAVNKQYQLLFITPHLREIEPAMKNTWMTGTATAEKRMQQFSHGYHQFFIGYNIEDYLDRFKKIMRVRPSEPLSAGSEMIPIALAHKVGLGEKAVTPVHFFDLAYTNIIEGVEELGKFYRNDEIPVREDSINKCIHCHLLPIDKVPEEQAFSVIIDQNNNAPAAYSKWMHTGEKENFSIVLSKPYLFRDYFNANHDFFVKAPFSALQPHLSKSRITLAVILLEMLQKSEMSEEQLRSILQDYYDPSTIQSVSDVIQQLFTTYFSSDFASKLKTRQSVIFNGSQYKYQTIYQLEFSDSVNLPYTDRIAVKDESDNVLFVIIKDLLFQNFDKGQTHSFLGKPYEITSFDAAGKVLKVRAANTKSVNVSFYKPVQSVAVGNIRHTIEDMSRKPSGGWTHPVTHQELNLEIEGFETNVSVRVNQWYEFGHYSLNDCTFFDATLMRERNYKNGRVLKVTFRFVKKQEYLLRKEDIRKSLQILFYEAMQSIFPHHAQYLIISSLGDIDTNLPWIFNLFNCDDKEDENAISFFFTEDAHIDLGLIGALSNEDILGTDYLFRYLLDYLIWLKEEKTQPVEGYDEYHNKEGLDRLTFLKYGTQELPAYFDVELLINFIRDFFCEELP